MGTDLLARTVTTRTPVAEMLAVLRPRLVGAGARFPSRKPSAQRLFFTPIEDFLVATRRGRKRRARIARSAVAPIWSLVVSDAACADAGRVAAELDAAIANGERDLSLYERALFREAALGFQRLIAHAETDAAFRADLAARLAPDGDAAAGASALHDLAEIAALLPHADLMKAAQAAFPRPFSALTEEDVYAARRIYARAFEEAPDAALYVLLALAARLDAPWRAIGLARPPLMLDAITGLACMEIHNSPAQAAAWLELFASHSATTQETRERACQMLLTLEPRLPVELIEVLDPTVDQSLDAVAGLLLS